MYTNVKNTAPVVACQNHHLIYFTDDSRSAIQFRSNSVILPFFQLRNKENNPGHKEAGEGSGGTHYDSNRE